MMRRLCKKSQKYQSIQLGDEGFGLPFVLYVIPVILICLSFVLDLGQAYRTRIYLQQAADAGALSGIGWSMVQDQHLPHDAALKESIELRAKQTAEANAHLNSVPSVSVEATYDSDTETVSVEITGEYQPLLGFQLFSSDTTLNVEADSRRAAANVMLVLDFSSSMRCPRDQPCDCLGVNRTTGVSCEDTGHTLKVEDLRAAVSSLLARFNPSRDRIGMVLFNMLGENTVAIRPSGSSGFVLADFDAINSRTPASVTNVADGLLRAWTDVDSANLLGASDVNYILVSDGKPTASRFLFTNTAAGLDTTPASTLGNYDYVHHSVSWVNSDSSSYFGPGLLVKTSEMTMDYSAGAPPRGIPGDDVPTCYTSSAALFPPTTPPSDAYHFEYVFNNCVGDLGFHLPGNPSATYGGSSCTDFPACYRQQYYHVPIAVADSLRRQRGFFYTIGIGEPAAPSSADPYQNISDTTSDAAIFLSRVANDKLEAQDVSSQTWGYAHPEFAFTNAETYGSLSDLGLAGNGRYYSSPTTDQLEEIFQKIATAVKLRLTR